MRKKLPNRRKRIPIQFEHGGKRFKGGIGLYADNSPGEVFLTASKSGTEIQISITDAAIAVSIGLQYGVPPEVFHAAFLKNEDGTPAGPLGKAVELMIELDGLTESK